MLIVGFGLGVFIKDLRWGLWLVALATIALAAWQAWVISAEIGRIGLRSDMVEIFAKKAFFGGVAGLVAFACGRKLIQWLERKKGTNVLPEAEH